MEAQKFLSGNDGRKAESEFRSWLDRNSFPWIFLDQEPGNGYSNYLRMDGVGRPDYIVIVPFVGSIAVDVKERSFLRPYNFYISQAELNKLCGFSSLSRMSIWVVFYASGDYAHFYIANLERVRSMGLKRYAMRDGNVCFDIPVSWCERISSSESRGFSIILNGINNI
ncbi:hypothetical protein [Nitrospirillum amazonense]|uniref:hypothetical protein n=1 Tax=Nitrospirillum amazonense TaxID=28077 RepID=UPI0011A161B2|nr:hypothetical protein [Nitrospirillum amazonense]